MGRPKIGSFSRENSREYRKQLRQEAVDYLGGKCSMCEITEDLEFDHLNVNDSEEDRKLRRNGKRNPKGQISSLWQLKIIIKMLDFFVKNVIKSGVAPKDPLHILY